MHWSEQQDFLTCPRKYELAHVEKLQKRGGLDRQEMLIGLTVHAAIQRYISLVASGSNPALCLSGAQAAAREFLADAVIENKEKYNYELRRYEPDEGYYAMVKELQVSTSGLIAYHLPRLGIGTRFKVLYRDEVIPGTDKYIPAVEWRLEVPDVGMGGVLDFVAFDTETNEVVLIDWKVRSSFLDTRLAQLDGQLHLYAALANHLGANISKVCMYQLRARPPQPAALSKRDGLPLTGAQSYDTTWEYWKSTLPMRVKAEKYEEVIRPKLKTDEDFIQPVFSEVTPASSQSALRNAQAVSKMIASTTEYPAVLSSFKCRYCEFQQLCSGPLRYNTDVRELISFEYEQRPERFSEE